MWGMGMSDEQKRHEINIAILKAMNGRLDVMSAHIQFLSSELIELKLKIESCEKN